VVIYVDRAPDGVRLSLVEPDAFDAFSVRIDDGVPAAAAAAALARVGRRADATHVLVDPAALTGLAGDRGRDADWLRGLEAMSAYARSAGWADEAGWIRAHIEGDTDQGETP
jgi:hypothetical protein